MVVDQRRETSDSDFQAVTDVDTLRIQLVVVMVTFNLQCHADPPGAEKAPKSGLRSGKHDRFYGGANTVM